jgi:hypothetical protein
MKVVTVLVFYMLNIYLINTQNSTASFTPFYTLGSAHINNNITGTGNLLKDEAYRSVCTMLNCLYCCQGDINLMSCGTERACRRHGRSNTLYYAIIIPLSILFAPLGAFTRRRRDPNSECDKCVIIYFKILFAVIIFPYGIYLICHRCGCCKKK